MKIETGSTIEKSNPTDARAPRPRTRKDLKKSLVLSVLFTLATLLAFAPSAFASEDLAWYEKIDVSGDFRARDELFVIDDGDDRNRLRYRLRVGAKTDINDHVQLGFRLATGSLVNSRNQTLGSGNDFDPDGVFIDKAYITLKPHGAEKPMFGDSLAVTFGKMSNPLKAKGVGPSILIWDGDQMPEGVALSWGASPRDGWSTNLDVGYFVIDENSSDPAKDPAVIAVQLDDKIEINDEITFNSHLSYQAFRKLDADFFDRVTDGDGSGYNGNTDSLSSNNHIDLIEFQGGTTLKLVDNWPITIWGNVVYNFSADSVGGGNGKQNLGYGVGVEAGDKKACARVGVAYYELEADAVPANLHDSDVFDGRSNGKSWQVYVKRQILENTDFTIESFFSEPLDDDVIAFQEAAPNDRVRIRFDITVKF